MVGRLRTAMELAGGIEGLLKGESGQPGRLATFLTLGGAALQVADLQLSPPSGWWKPAGGLCACCRSAAGVDCCLQPAFEEPEGCYLLSMRWFSLEEERVMQQSSVSISLSF